MNQNLEAESQKQPPIPMLRPPSIQTKPFSFSNFTPQLHRRSFSFSRSRKRISSAAAVVDPYMSDSTTGSTKNRNRLQYLSTVPAGRHSPATPPRTPSPDDWVGEGNHMTCRTQKMMKTRRKTKYATIHVEKTKNDTKKSKNIKEIVQIPLYGDDVHDKGLPIVMPLNCTHVKNMNNDVKVISKPHSTGEMNGKEKVVKDNRKAVVVGSTLVNLSKKYKEKDVVTPYNPIGSGAMKKAKGSSCQPLSRTRNEVEGAEDELQTKSLAYHLPNNKKGRFSSKGSFKKFVTPQDFIDQQKAYFKEIDEYELDVEEVE